MGQSAPLSVGPGLLAVAGAASAVPFAAAETGISPTGVTSAGIFSGRRCDPHAIRRKFPAKWSGFLRAHFRDAVEVAYVFSVDAKTARLWWEGSTGPQGWAVDFAHRTFPTARTWMEAA